MKRRIGLFGALAIGVGGMVGGGIFAVLGEAISMAHGGTPVAFAIAGAIAALTSHSYARLSVRYPKQGGTVVFIDQAFGVDLLTGALNLTLWLSYLVTISLYAAAFASYGATFFGESTSPLLHHVLISGAIVVPVGINLANADLVSRSEALIVTVKLVLLAVVIGAGAVHIEPERLAPSTWAPSMTLVAAGMVIFVAYEGFELIANSAEEIIDPARTLPRAFYGSVGFVVLLYLAVAFVTVGTVPEQTIIEAKDYALAEAARPALGQFGFTIVAVSALLATLSAINATVYGNARLGFSLARDGELPHIVERTRGGRPTVGVVVTGALSLVIANTIDLTAIAILGSACFLLVFAVVNAAAVRTRSETGANPLISGLGCLACTGALAVLLIQTSDSNPNAIWVFAGFLLFALLFEAIYPRIVGRPLRCQDSASDAKSLQ